MKAAVIRQNGPAEMIRVEETPAPSPAPGEVLVQVKAAALNHLDIWVRQGSRSAELKAPHVLGSDGAGVVTALGEGVTEVAVGDEVILFPGLPCGRCPMCLSGRSSLCEDFGIVGMSRPGTFAQFVAVPAQNAAPKPAHLEFTQAAGLALAHLTAWRMVYTRGGCLPGQTVLIHGIGGGVALAALQLAKLGGAVVIVTSSSDDKLARAHKLGADHTVNYRTAGDIPDAVRQLTAGRGVDLVIDTVGAATLPVSIATARRGGRIVLCGVTGGADATADLRAIYWNQLDVLGSTLGNLLELRQMLSAMSAAKLEPVIDSVFTLEDVVAATQKMESGQQFGKIVLEIKE